MVICLKSEISPAYYKITVIFITVVTTLARRMDDTLQHIVYTTVIGIKIYAYVFMLCCTTFLFIQ